MVDTRAERRYVLWALDPLRIPSPSWKAPAMRAKRMSPQWRRLMAAAVVVATNFTAEPQTVSLSAQSAGVMGTKLKTLLKTPGAADPESIDKIELPPFGVFIGEVE